MDEINNVSFKKHLTSWLPFAPENCLEMVDPIDCPKHEPQRDEWGYPIIEIYVKNESLSPDEMNELLKKNQISLLEGAHLLIGMKISNFSSKILTKPLAHIYQKVMEGIRKKELKVEHIDARGFWNNRPYEEEIIIHSADGIYLVRIQDSKHGQAHFFKPHIFLEWALSSGLFIEEKLLKLINVLPVAECFEHSKVDASYIDSNYILEADLILIKQTQYHDLALKVAAQVIWEAVNPNMSIPDMEKHELIKNLLPQNSYSNKDAFRNKIKDIDPRPPQNRTRNSSNKLTGHSHPPKMIPGVFRINKSGKSRPNFFMLRHILKMTFLIFFQINQKISFDDLIKHRLVSMYLAGAHPIIKGMVKNWFEEVKKSSNNVYSPVVSKRKKTS